VYPVDHLPVLLRAADVLGPAVVAVGLCALASGPVAVLAARAVPLVALRR
jgi:ABC-type lipoprotein release transport system permease subunit